MVGGSWFCEPFVVAQPSGLWGQRASCPLIATAWQPGKMPGAPTGWKPVLPNKRHSLNFPNYFSQRQKFLYRCSPAEILFLDDFF